MSVKLHTAAELQTLILRPAPESVNSGLVCPTSGWLVDKLGSPELKVTQRRIKLGSEQVGPVHLYGAKIARQALWNVFRDVKAAGRTDLLDNLHTEGMYNLRKVRGSSTSWSTHSWGLAGDLNYGPGEEMGDSLVQFGLMQIYPFFHARRWYWGGGYHRAEDGMHFEPSTALIEDWIKQGLL